MESLEDNDLVKSLNFTNALAFLQLVEADLTRLVLAAQKSQAVGGHRMIFPPLKPRYSTLLQLTVARFGLRATLRGWGDERRVVVDAMATTALPRVQCTDFRPPGEMELAKRLVDTVGAAEPLLATAGTPMQNSGESVAVVAEVSGGYGGTSAQSMVSEGREEQPRTRGKDKGGMRGWSDDDQSDDDWIAKRRKASVTEGKVTKGRGFNSNAEMASEASANGRQDEDDTMECALQENYERYVIDPEDTWSPQRKPYVELADQWEFSGAWSFEPDQNENKEEAKRRTDGSRGICVWRVEHAKGGNFTVAFSEGHPGDARRWLEGTGRSRGEEPFVLEFSLNVQGKCWEYRFGRATQRQGWRTLPWSNVHRSSFWVATYPGDDCKQHFAAGLDEFPERRFFFAKMRLEPRFVGFGPAEKRGGGESFFIRDVSVYARSSLLPSPFASRDHFVEISGLSREEVNDAIKHANLSARIAGVFPPRDGAAILVCRSSEDSAIVADALSAAMSVTSSEWRWPPEGVQDTGPAAAQNHAQVTRESWSKLHVETTRELAIFEEHTQRRTRHLEGMRIARTSATRMILGNLKGDAPLPKPPEVGV